MDDFLDNFENNKLFKLIGYIVVIAFVVITMVFGNNNTNEDIDDTDIVENENNDDTNIVENENNEDIEEVTEEEKEGKE